VHKCMTMEEQKVLESLPKDFADALFRKLHKSVHSAIDVDQNVSSLRREIEEGSVAKINVYESATYSCPACGSKLIVVIERVVRRADEGSVMEANCSECHHRYTID
jgi:DNA-directed RNA polymerase subunit M/transcription elongation factor TFIIS